MTIMIATLLGLATGFATSRTFTPPEHLITIVAIITPLFIIEILLIKKLSQKNIRLKELKIDGDWFGYFSLGFGAAMIIYPKIENLL
ncbi:hypothetical protein [Vandammella animalimorsus]|uniref:hypothetical protein n=1 Tax=Vandammella animalimorsus TaxID=2029117 RepID=UPI0011C4A52E|nr:hypothetical protein [Vandammella animalimorsus]